MTAGSAYSCDSTSGALRISAASINGDIEIEAQAVESDPGQGSTPGTTPTSDEPSQGDEIRMIKQPPVWTKGSNVSASFTSSAEFADFLYVRVDGEVVDEANYDAEEGSTIVTFKAKFLETLSEGKHPVEIVSRTGIARGLIDIKGPAAKPTEDETQSSETDAETQPGETDTIAKTGTNSGTYLWLALFLLSTGGLLLVLRRKRMLKHEDPFGAD